VQAAAFDAVCCKPDGNLQYKISTGSHSRLGNPEKQDFHKCLNPSDSQLAQLHCRCWPYNQEKEKKNHLLLAHRALAKINEEASIESIDPMQANA